MRGRERDRVKGTRTDAVEPAKKGRRFVVASDASTEVVGERASSAGVALFSLTVFLVVFVAVLGAWAALAGPVGAVAAACALVAAGFAAMAVHIAQQWEKVVVLRFGRFNRVSGPGLFWTFPIIEQNTMRVDTRVRAPRSAPRRR